MSRADLAYPMMARSLGRNLHQMGPVGIVPRLKIPTSVCYAVCEPVKLPLEASSRVRTSCSGPGLFTERIAQLDDV